MNKTLKRTLAMVMVVAMLFALGVTAFADNDQYTVTAYVRLQTAEAPEDWDLSYGDLENISFLTPYSQATGRFVQVQVSQNTPITVKDIVEALYGVTVISCTNHDGHGCIHSDTVLSGETACSCSTCNCTWKRVKDMTWDENAGAYVWTGDYASALNSLYYLGNTYTNNSTTTGDSTHGTYSGTSWEYFVANNSYEMGMYPETLYMDQYVVSSSLYITLSFDTSSFEW